MKRPANYRTKQREAILGYIVSLGGEHVTAARIAGHFADDAPIGRATIYRHLEKLTNSGKLRKFTADGVSGACYQYAEDDAGCHTHLHLKCECCGALMHLQCDTLGELQRHIYDKHAFEVNTSKTVLYGRCDSCIGKA